MRGNKRKFLSFAIAIMIVLVVAVFFITRYLRHKSELKALHHSVYTVPIVWAHPRLDMFFKCVVAFTPYQKKHVFSV